MGLADEFKGDFLKTLGMLGVILGFVFLFFMWTISIWLVVFAVALIAGIIWLFGAWRSGRL